ncbi:MAG: 7,8-didemethyl-8-hydroxy-5-deazariboflavin synthase subunit CofH [Synechococcales cyanobacterium K44_A2020_017]|nr:7,8-didemethyl-8-hydroxy-5-deazariboflavin synthase subunit CofH [Synechococcales cyanobacterium K32_A2020_035]MBF2095029.1 7,8-didemethyl-8-hydroxy-5-deazariboflavin synthase subunit CofH [Synechococcales cyanobacterium K44_A2020_017]
MPLDIQPILDRALAGYDLTESEGVALLEAAHPTEAIGERSPLPPSIQAARAIQETADQLRQRQAGDTVTYVVNRNINFTNICEQHCSFCAFRRDANQPGAYWLNDTVILEKTADAVQRGATEICMQGGLNLEAKHDGASLPYYLSLVNTIKSAFPQLHLHAFSPQEVEFIAREDGCSYAAVIEALQAAGVGSMPGTAAEVLDDDVRKVLCPEKINTQTWIDVVETAHHLGMPTTSTILSGHIETPRQQIHHLEQLRSLQQRAQQRGQRGITEFIVLPFVGQEAPAPLRRRVGRDQPSCADALVLMAVARIFLGNWIPNHQPSWVKLGLAGATEALRWGCNDIGGTLMEEHITTMAGAQGGTCMEVEDLQQAIRSIGRQPQERDTLYQPVHRSSPIPIQV